MTEAFIKDQVEIIREATRIASQSKETARKFLEEAGIIKKQNGSTTTASGPLPSIKKK